jgi:hypothetical protein
MGATLSAYEVVSNKSSAVIMRKWNLLADLGEVLLA